MKPMIWRPEPSDRRVNEYLDRINHEPWIAIVGVSLLIVSTFTILVILGTF